MQKGMFKEMEPFNMDLRAQLAANFGFSWGPQAEASPTETFDNEHYTNLEFTDVVSNGGGRNRGNTLKMTADVTYATPVEIQPKLN